MAIALTMTSRTETNITLSVTGQASGGQYELQYGTTRDFRFCIAPIIGPLTQASVPIPFLNRSQTYFWRAREVVNGVRQAWNKPAAFSTLPGTDTPAPSGVQVQPAVIVIPQPINSIVGSGTVAGYPVENLLNPSPIPAWRAIMSGNAGLQIELSGEPFDTIALLDTNLPESAQIAVFAGNSRAEADTAAPYATALLPFRASANLPGRRGYHSLIRLASPIAFRFINIQIATRVVGDVMHMTHLVIGLGRTVKNFADLNDQSFDLGTLERTRDGAADAVRGFRGRRVDFEIAAMTEQQYEQQFSEIAALVGNTDPVFIIPNSRPGPYLHDRLLYGNLTGGRMSYSNARITRSFSIDSVIN